MDIKLSIIIPAFNVENFLSRCIDSILLQNIDEESYELIIINDGSEDHTESIARKYTKNHKNFFLESTENHGVSCARNLGLTLAKGEYIYFLDSDDFLYPDSLRSMLLVALRNDLDIISFSFKRSLNSKKIDVKKLDFDIDKDYNYAIKNGQQYLTDEEFYFSGVCWYLFKSKLRKRINLQFDEGRMIEDVVFTLQLFLNANRILHLPQCVYCYSINDNSILTTNNTEHNNRILDDYKFMIIKFSDIIENYGKNQKLKARMELMIGKEIEYLLKRIFLTNPSYKKTRILMDELLKRKLYPLTDRMRNKSKFSNKIFLLFSNSTLRLYLMGKIYKTLKLIKVK